MPVGADGTPVNPGRPSAREIAASLALAALGFLTTAGLLHAAIRDPLHLHADTRSEKLVMLQQWHGKIFSAAFGTSHVHNGFDPRAFDLTLAGSPLATHTANLAVEGGAQPEQFAMAQQFVEHLESPAQAGAPPQPCLVLLELGAGANFTPDHIMTARAINVYAWPEARLVTRLVDPQMPVEQRLGRIGYALAELALHYMNVGMLSNQIFKPPLSETVLTEQTKDDRRGLMLLSGLEWYQGKLREILRSRPASPAIRHEPLLPGNLEMIQQLAASSAVRNVTFAYIVMPKLTDIFAGADYPDHVTVSGPWGPMDVPVINLARADRFPQLYADTALWHDEAHFYPQGARVASQLLAQQLKQWYAVHGEPKPCG
jgi:hypothetical protein